MADERRITIHDPMYEPIGKLDAVTLVSNSEDANAIALMQGGPTVFTPDEINHPLHYNNSQACCECGRRVECIDVTRHFNFNLGNVIKYVWRAGLKGEALKDLKKALWYLQDEIKQWGDE